MNDVVVALVTYNRRVCLEETLKGIVAQEHKVKAVVIVDNNSTDDTNIFMTSFMRKDVSNYLEFHCATVAGIEYIYYRNNVNVGGSGGFAVAINKAIELHKDYIWIMDDDVLPEPNCLKLMLEAMSKDVRACIPNRSDVNFDDHACRKIDFKSTLKFRMYMRKEFYAEPLDSEYYSVCDMAFEGPLIKSDVVEKVGLPYTGFFIEYDDTDYAQRVLKHTKILFVSNAVLHRQLATRDNGKQTRNYKYNWRNYYSIRNNILFNHMYGESWGAKHLGTPMLCGWHIARSIIHMQPGNIKIILKATIDGIRNRAGIVVKPGEL